MNSYKIAESWECNMWHGGEVKILCRESPGSLGLKGRNKTSSLKEAV